MGQPHIKVRHCPGWKKFQVVSFGVSVFSPLWQGENFADMMEFVPANFPGMEVLEAVVTDLLYYHNFMAVGLSETAAKKKALDAGDEWIETHQPIIQAFPYPNKLKLIRWKAFEEGERQAGYFGEIAHFWQAYAHSAILREAVEDDFVDYCRRQHQHPTPFVRQCGERFLVQENAGSSILARERRTPSLKLYPGGDMASRKVVHHGLVPEAPYGLQLESFGRLEFHGMAQQAHVETPATAHRPLSRCHATASRAALGLV